MSLDTDLREFSKSLAPIDGQCCAFTKVKNDLSRILNHEFDVDRLVVSGSHEKATGVKFIKDLEVFVFFKNKSPSIKVLPSTVGEAIKTSRFSEPYLRRINYEPRECAVNFTVRLDGYEIKIDVVLATSKVFEDHREKIGKSQWNNLTQEMSTLSDDERKLYRYGLSEASSAFIKQQSSDIHALIRLAKCWSFANLDDKMPGLSSLVETIAVYAGQKFKTKGGSQFNLVDAFKQFLIEIGRIRSLNIIFEMKSLKRKVKVPRDTLSQRPNVVESSGVVNNRLKITSLFNDNFLQKLERKGLSTKETLERSEDISELMQPDNKSQYFESIMTALAPFSKPTAEEEINPTTSLPAHCSMSREVSRSRMKEIDQKLFIHDCVFSTNKCRRINFSLPSYDTISVLRTKVARFLNVPLESLVLKQRRCLAAGKLAVKICDEFGRPNFPVFGSEDGTSFTVPYRYNGQRITLRDNDYFPLIPGERIIIVALKKKAKMIT